jgi:hypothetical protein
MPTSSYYIHIRSHTYIYHALQCPSGYLFSGSGASACTACSLGQYAKGTGAISCGEVSNTHMQHVYIYVYIHIHIHGGTAMEEYLDIKCPSCQYA